jgi:hypothetical protein
MKLKVGVNPLRIQPELLLALYVADTVWRDNAQELVVTSLNDSVHSKASLHYAGCAADLRTRYFTDEKKAEVAEQLRLSLGSNPDYDVVVEKDHIHLEYQPKRRSL